MVATWGVLIILCLLCSTESKCSRTTFYKNCWIRRFPGICIDVAESQWKGAQLLKFYREDTAQKCSRTCCLARNVSCNLAVFHYESTQNRVNCLHLHCPTLESCVLSRSSIAILYNISKGIDPDLLVFGKYPTSSLRLWTNLSSSRFNSSDSSSSDKRQFHRLPFSSNPVQSSPPSIHESLLPSTSWGPSSSSTASTPVPTITTWLSSSTTMVSVPDETQPTIGYSSRTTASTQTSTPSSTTPTTASLSPETHPQFTTASPVTKPYSNIAAVPSNFESSKQYPNETKGYVSRNTTSEEEPSTLSPFWEVATDTLLVPVVICSAILFVCCCTVLFGAGRRSRKTGHYKPVWKADRGSMRLIKYMMVRESL
ncbi:MANSC domain-containing protein 4-like [Polyodon spathula]|uniref:MANSC domain-containing protein 4-like n=1 Tax=Polyodon spathula TaxID=7913 RepID=UPI001B7E1C15|nr:MANSC domain-containing protein 4-like [Polyodon spathula]